MYKTPSGSLHRSMSRQGFVSVPKVFMGRGAWPPALRISTMCSCFLPKTMSEETAAFSFEHFRYSLGF